DPTPSAVPRSSRQELFKIAARTSGSATIVFENRRSHFRVGYHCPSEFRIVVRALGRRHRRDAQSPVGALSPSRLRPYAAAARAGRVGHALHPALRRMGGAVMARRSGGRGVTTSIATAERQP